MEELLSELQTQLYGHNYQVFLRVYRVPYTENEPPEWYVTQSLSGSAIIGGIVPVTGPEILTEVEQSLQYAGDEGSGPEASVLCSLRFKELVSAVLGELNQAIAEATLLAQFWLQEGHPAYPVFWDFAFVIAGTEGGIVLIGSSSD